MKRILICTTILTTVKAFLIPHIRLLQEMGYIVDVAAHRDATELDGLVNQVYDLPFQRTPFSKSNLVASRRLKEIVQGNHYQMLHFHTPVAGVFGRWAVKQFRKAGVKIVYTAHGFHFFKDAPVQNWLLYYPAERILSRYTDVLITINKEDYIRAQSFKANKTLYVPGVGLNVSSISAGEAIKHAKRAEIGLPQDALVLLSVGELNENKNHETIIKALAQLRQPDIYYVICGEGIRRHYLQEMATSLGVADQTILLGFRSDVKELYPAADIFVFPSYREGLPVALMEAMAAGLPVVCSKIRGNIDLIEDGQGGYLCEANEAAGFVWAIRRAVKDAALRQRMGSVNLKAVQNFDLEYVQKEMAQIYQQVLEG